MRLGDTKFFNLFALIAGYAFLPRHLLPKEHETPALEEEEAEEEG